MTKTSDRAKTPTTRDSDDRHDRDDDSKDERHDSVTTLHRGIARAISRGLSAYERELTSYDDGRLDLGTGLVEGVLSGMSDFYDELSATSRDVLDDVRENRRKRRSRRRDRDEDRGEARIEIDYDRLAKLVAEELRKSGPTTVGS